MTTNAPRAPIDFDAFERDLRQAEHPQAGSSGKGDPLAELARIVGQDDPFRALLASHQAQGSGRAAGRPAQDGRIEPDFYDAPAHPEPGREAQPPSMSPADAFDQYLATVERDSYAAEAGPDSRGHDADEPAASGQSRRSSFRDVLARRPRKQLVQVGAGLGVLMLCVTGALAWKSLGSHGSDGQPVTVLADKTPLKVAPQTADGVEIPDQNKQIYERGAKDDRIKVVNREEQPLDVAQAARSASRNGTTPGNVAMLTDSLGEPRRVRTVAVKPDTPAPAAPPQREAAAEVGQAPPSPIPTMTMPGSEGTATPAAAPPRRPSRTLASTTASPPSSPPASSSASPSSSAEAPAAEPPAPAPAPRKAVQRVASVAPETTASTAEEPAASPAPAATASVGGYSVQLGVRNSESDARAAFKQMQTKYAQLSGKPELIRQAEIDGKTIFRVRVGPLAKTEANGLCTELKGAGGQCFVAKN